MVRVIVAALLLLTGCNALESDEAQEVARVTQRTVERGVDEAAKAADEVAKAADRAAEKTKEQLERVDLEKLERAWEAAVEALESDDPRSPGTSDAEPLAGIETALQCDEAREHCTITAELVERARRHGAAIVRQVGVSAATGDVRGIRIDSIEAGSIAERVGFAVGDVVTQVNGVALESPQDAMSLYLSVRSAKRFEVHYRRGSQARTLVVEVV
ncbi:PDZ domain-containing protein [Paraliomyxa miuraensis]|uniref:PDZ domain-containing protein n=1 Tax=Paraliomyxa miuraensis TaxID=376150 RepID=UPI0022556B69|nr:PDZ domain-containing protein [Paraliomyxa miuraensis]MCX4247661.1 PDZ domain-containing protein [Paraliomyxa miuraensis]